MSAATNAADGRPTPDKGGFPVLFEAMHHEELLREQGEAQQQLAQAGKDLLERAGALQSIAHVAADAMGEVIGDEDLKPAALGALCPLACRALVLVEQLANRLRNAEGALRAAESRERLMEGKMRAAAAALDPPRPPPPAAAPETAQEPHMPMDDAAAEPYAEITFTLSELLQEDTCDSGPVGEFFALLEDVAEEGGDPADEATVEASPDPPPSGPQASPQGDAPPPHPISAPPAALTSEATVTAASATALLEAAWSGPREQKAAATAATGSSAVGSGGAAKPSKNPSQTKAAAAAAAEGNVCGNKRQKTSCECGRAEASYCLPKGPGGGNEAAARWCSRCPGKPPGAVNGLLRPCECGASVAGFGLPGTLPKDLKWCHKCPGKLPGAVYAGGLRRGGKRKLCGCGSAGPIFGLPWEDKKLARWCARCPDKPSEAVDVMSARCECGKTSHRSFALPGGKRRWCSKCPSRPPEAVFLCGKRCECGLKIPSLGFPGQRRKDARWCKDCPEKPSGAVDVVSKRCECGLTVSPSFAPPGGSWKDSRWCVNCPGKPPDARSLRNEQYAARVAKKKAVAVAAQAGETLAAQ